MRYIIYGDPQELTVLTIVSSVHNEKGYRDSQGPFKLKQQRMDLLTISLLAASLILSTFASESPLTLHRGSSCYHLYPFDGTDAY